MPPGLLAGLKVIDCSTMFAAPLTATFMADFGAEVIKIEHPKGDPLRGMSYSKNGIGLWWKIVSRNKRCITLNLSQPAGAELFKKLAAEADVVLENFRPGTMERWGLGWDVLHALNPRLIMLRMTGFGQTGPYVDRPGFGTLAESMSGFAHITGQPDRPPVLPPFGLADGMAALTGAFSAAFALYHREKGGPGQMIDVAIYEPLLTILGPQPTVYDQLGIIQERTGNRVPNVAPRNTYQTQEGRWVAISAPTNNIAERVMRLVGCPEVISEPWFNSARTRAEHADELDEMVGSWIAERSLEQVIDAFEAAEAAVAPIYDVSHVMSDPHFLQRSIVSVPDEDFGSIKMQNVLAQFSATPGAIRHTGPSLGAHNAEVYGEMLGLSESEISAHKAAGII